MLRRVALVRTGISKEFIASIIRVTRIGKLGTLAVTSNRSTLISSCHPDDGGQYAPQKSQFLQKPHSITSEKTIFFIVTAVKT
jgi:hypothetical protein